MTSALRRFRLRLRRHPPQARQQHLPSVGTRTRIGLKHDYVNFLSLFLPPSPPVGNTTTTSTTTTSTTSPPCGICNTTYLYQDEICYIYSPNYPGDYPDCVCQEWVFQASDQDKIIQFRVLDYDVRTFFPPMVGKEVTIKACLPRNAVLT